MNILPLKDLKDERGVGEKRGSLVQWLGLGVFTAMAQVQPLVRELRSHKPAMWQKKKKREREREDGQVANDCNRARCSSREMCRGGIPNLAVMMQSF